MSPLQELRPLFNSLFHIGLKTRRKVVGEAFVDKALKNGSTAFSRPGQELVTQWCWGWLWNRPGLQFRDRSLLNIGLLMALNRGNELGTHIRGARNNGVSEEEIREAILHATVYCGVPSGVEAFKVAEAVLDDMREKGEKQRQLGDRAREVITVGWISDLSAASEVGPYIAHAAAESEQATQWASFASLAKMNFPRRVRVKNPIVDLNGDEMTRVIWKEIKDRLIRPFFDVQLDYYDLGLPNRDKTEDKVTLESVEAVRRHRVAVKCPTISVDTHRIEEYKLKKAWKSPNGTLRQAVGGTLFRAPIIIPGLPRAVPGWTKPIILARHAFGDLFAGQDRLFEEAGTLSMIFRPRNGGPPTEVKVSELPDSGGVVMAHSNTTESITGFARSTFKFALQKTIPVYLATKSSILRHYDGHFQDIFEQVYDKEFRSQFEPKGLFYEHRINDELLAHLYKIDGDVLVAMKNYDGDAQSDALAQAFGSQALMTSALVSPDDNIFVAEAAHGTVTKHYYAHLKGESTSTNPIACIFAWTQALIRRGELDGTPEVVSVAKGIEKATIDTVAVDNMLTKDLALLFKDERRRSFVSTNSFLDAVQKRILSRISN